MPKLNSSESFILGPKLRDSLRSRINRTFTLSVQQRDRRLVRSVHEYLRGCYPGCLDGLKIMPVSSMEWTSEARNLEGSPVVLFDIEQGNAIDFHIVRSIAQEKPIFNYIEYAIRCGELLYTLGDRSAALSLSRKAEARLRHYSLKGGKYPALPRPMIPAAIFSAAEFAGSIVNAYILGHEIGHYLSDMKMGPKAQFRRLEKVWKSISFDPAADGSNRRYARFILPHSLQRIGEDGKPAGNGVLGSRIGPQIGAIESRMISEAHADYVGLICATEVARTKQIHPHILISILFHMLEAMERHVLIRQISTQLPRGPVRSSIILPASRLETRRRMLTESVHMIRSGSHDKKSTEYWAAAEDILQSAAERDKFSRSAHLSNVLARGALYLGLGGEYPTTMPAEEIRKTYGPIAGDIISMQAPFYFEKGVYELDDNTNIDSASIGFAAAIKDLTSTVVHGGHTTHEANKSGDFATDIELIRRSRIAVARWSVSSLD